MFSFVRDAWESLRSGGAPSLFMVLFVYVWVVWSAKALAARRYRPWTRRAGAAGDDRDRARLQRARGAVPPRARERRANRPTEIIVVVDGGDANVAAVAADYGDRVLRMPKEGKRAAIAAGLRESDPAPTSCSWSTPTRCGRRTRCARCCARSPTRAWAA